jgi:MarR family transcriptional regulator, organic hydroperoxide resistance regulator
MSEILSNEDLSTAARVTPGTGSRTVDLVRSGMDGFLGYHLRLAYLAISRHFAKVMAPVDLTQKQLGVLWLIGANGGVSQVTIARELGMDRASMMAIVDRLQDRGLVVRERSRHDGRRQELYLTPQGRKVLAKAKTIIGKHERWMTERFREDEVATLMQLLRRLHR